MRNTICPNCGSRDAVCREARQGGSLIECPACNYPSYVRLGVKAVPADHADRAAALQGLEPLAAMLDALLATTGPVVHLRLSREAAQGYAAAIREAGRAAAGLREAKRRYESDDPSYAEGLFYDDALKALSILEGGDG